MNQDEIDAGADALRRFEQGGKRLRLWDQLPNGVKNRWREKANIVLDAIRRETLRKQL